MMRLQGIDPTKFVVAVPEGPLGQQIGNAMSVNVVERIMVKVFEHTKLVRKSAMKEHNPLRDRWAEGKGFNQTQPPQWSKFELQDKDKEMPRMLMSLETDARNMMIDSGASFHLIGQTSLTSNEYANKYKLRDPIPLRTANGISWAEEATQLYISKLGLYVEAIILENSPAVLSLGKLVEDEEFEYHWKPGETPYLERKAPYIKIMCLPTHNVPFLVPGVNAMGWKCKTETEAKAEDPVQSHVALTGDNSSSPQRNSQANSDKTILEIDESGNGGNTDPGGDKIETVTGDSNPQAKAKAKARVKVKAKAKIQSGDVPNSKPEIP